MKVRVKCVNCGMLVNSRSEHIVGWSRDEPVWSCKSEPSLEGKVGVDLWVCDGVCAVCVNSLNCDRRVD